MREDENKQTQRVAEVVCRILRKIHDPRLLREFERDLSLVATGIEDLDWLKKEYRIER